MSILLQFLLSFFFSFFKGRHQFNLLDAEKAILCFSRNYFTKDKTALNVANATSMEKGFVCNREDLSSPHSLHVLHDLELVFCGPPWHCFKL